MRLETYTMPRPPDLYDTDAMYAGSLKSLKNSMGMVMPKTARWSAVTSSGRPTESTVENRRRPGGETANETGAVQSQRYPRGQLHPHADCDLTGVKKVRTELVPPTFKDNPQDNPEHMERRVSSSSNTLSSLSDESIENDSGTGTACQRSRQHIETVVENMRHEASKCGKDGAIRELNFFLCESGPIDSNHSLNQPQGTVVFYRVFPNPSYVPPTDPEAATVVSPMKTRLEAHRNMQHYRRIKNFVTMSNMVATEKYETYRATLAMVREAVEERAGYLGAKFTDTEEAFLLDELDHFMKSLPFGANQPVGLQSLAHMMLDHAIDVRTAHLAALLHASRQPLQSVSPDVKAMHDALNLQGDYSRIMFRFMDAARVYAMMHLGAYSNLSAPQKEVMGSVTEKFRDLNENNRLSTDPYVDLYRTLTECFSPQLRYRALHLPWLFHSALDAEHIQRFFLEACAPKDQSTAVYDNGSRRHEMTTYVVCAGKAKLEEYGLWDRQLIAGGVPRKHVALPRQFGGAVYVGADLCLVRDVDNKKVFEDSGPHLVRYSVSRNEANSDIESAQALCIALFTSLGDALPNQDVARYLRQQTAMGNVTVALGAQDAERGRRLLDLYEVSGQAVVFAPKKDRTWTKRRNDVRTVFVPVDSDTTAFHDHVLDAASGYDAMSVLIDESADPACVSFALISVLCSVDDSVRVHLHKNWMLPKNRPHTGDVAAVVRALEHTPVSVGRMDNLKHAMEKAVQHGDVYVADLLTSNTLHGNASPWTTEISGFYTFTNLFQAKKIDANAVHAFVSETAEKKKTPESRPLSSSRVQDATSVREKGIADAQATQNAQRQLMKNVAVQPENTVQTLLSDVADAVQNKIVRTAESANTLKRDTLNSFQRYVQEALDSSKDAIENNAQRGDSDQEEDDTPDADSVASEEATEEKDSPPAIRAADGSDNRLVEPKSTLKRMRSLKRIGLKSNLTQSVDDKDMYTDQNGGTWRVSSKSGDEEVYVTKEGTGGWERLRFPLRLLRRHKGGDR
jgi:hypothetical protein